MDQARAAVAIRGSAGRRPAGSGQLLLLPRFVLVAAVNHSVGTMFAWLLPSGQYGQVAALQNVLLFGAGFLSASFPARLILDLARAAPGREPRAQVRVALIGNAALGGALGLALIAAQVDGLALIPTRSPLLVVIVAVTLPVLAVDAVLAGALQGSGRLAGLAVQQTAHTVIRCVAGLILVEALPLGAPAVALAALLGSTVSVGIGLAGCRGLLPAPRHHRDHREPRRPPAAAGVLSRRPGGLPAGTVPCTVLLTADVLALGLLSHAGAAPAAGLVAAYQVCVVLAKGVYFVAEAVDDAMVPVVAGAAGTTAAHRRMLAVARRLPLLVAPALLPLILLPGPVLGLVFPPAYRQATGPLRLLALGTAGLVLLDLLGKTLHARDRTAVLARALPVAAVVQLIALGLLVPRWGATGAAGSYALACWFGAGLVLLGYLRWLHAPAGHLSRAGRAPAVRIGGFGGIGRAGGTGDSGSTSRGGIGRTSGTERTSPVPAAGYLTLLPLAKLIQPWTGRPLLWPSVALGWLALLALARRLARIGPFDRDRLRALLAAAGRAGSRCRVRLGHALRAIGPAWSARRARRAAVRAARARIAVARLARIEAARRARIEAARRARLARSSRLAAVRAARRSRRARRVRVRIARRARVAALQRARVAAAYPRPPE